MFIRLFTYRLRVLLRNRSLLFWTFAFPIVLGLLFNLAFGDLDKIGGIEQSTVGIVSTNEANQKRFENVLKEIKQDGKVVFKSQVMISFPVILQLMKKRLSCLSVKATHSRPF
jgi:ABC-2 type transport system permease protein